MELLNSHWRCQICHAVIDVPADAKLVTAFETRGGGSLRYVIRAAETIVHTCAPSWVRPTPVESR